MARVFQLVDRNKAKEYLTKAGLKFDKQGYLFYKMTESLRRLHGKRFAAVVPTYRRLSITRNISFGFCHRLWPIADGNFIAIFAHPVQVFK